MDIPINMLHWEVFLPERFQVKDFGGDVIAASLLPVAVRDGSVAMDRLEYFPAGVAVGSASAAPVDARFPGQVGGVVVDPSGAVMANANVTVTNASTGVSMNAVTDANGRWLISNFPSGSGKIRVDATGFKTLVQQFAYDANRPAEYMSNMSLAAATETVEVSAQAVEVPMNGRNYVELSQLERAREKQLANAASANVMNLQRRVAGVLPVAIEVPRTGTSFAFAKALVLDEETKVTFNYKSR
jgi:hypothetical protein